MTDGSSSPERPSADADAITLRQQAEALAKEKTARSPEQIERMPAGKIADLLHEMQVHQLELELQNEELQQAKDELEDSRSRYFDLYHLAPVGYCTISERGLILESNLTAANLLGMPRSMLANQPLSRFLAKQDQDTYYLHRRRLQKSQKSDVTELRITRPDGSALWIYLQCSIQQDADSQPEFHCILSDISERKQAEQALRESETLAKDILNSLPAHIAVLDPGGTIVAVNEPWLEFAAKNGNPLTEKIGVGANYITACQSACASGDPYAKKALNGVQAVLTGKQRRFTMEYPCDAPDEARWFAMEVLQSAGNTAGAIVAHSDVTIRVEAAEKLRRANQQLRLHFEQTPMAAIEWDVDFRVVRWNPAAETIFGFTPEEVIGRRSTFLIPESYASQVNEIWQALLDKRGGERSTNENLRKDGSVILCEWYNTPLIDERGSCIGVASLVMDITDRMRAQRLLAWEKSAFELIVSRNTLGETLDGLMRGLEALSPGMRCSVLLLDEDEIHLRHGAAPSLPDAYNHAIDGSTIGPGSLPPGIAIALGKQVIIADLQNEIKDDDFRNLSREHGLRSCWSTPIHGDHGKIRGVLDIHHAEALQPTPEDLDLISRAEHIIRIAIERKEVEEKLYKFNAELEQRVAERTRELQTANSDLEAFTYSVSHDLRAPLRAVGGFSRMVLEDYSSELDQEGHRMLNVIHSEAGRMGRLIDELLAFSRIGRQPIERAAIDMETLAREVFEELAASDPERKVRLQLHHLPRAEGATAMLRQVWVNLISNAIKFTRNCEIAEIEIGSQVDKAGEAVYYIKDNGAGFDMRHAEKLFGVFQRLHSQQEFPGTGVGLAFVQRVVQRHGGRIWADSKPGKFAAFYFTIPKQS